MARDWQLETDGSGGVVAARVHACDARRHACMQANGSSYYDADARDNAVQANRTDNPAFSAVQDTAHDAEDDDADGDGDVEGAADSTDPPPAKKAKKVNPLKDFDSRKTSVNERERMTCFGFDVELTESNREHFGWCNLGVQVLKPAPDGKTAAPSEDPADHFNERCLDKDAGWSQHATDVHGITEESLKEEGARDHLVVAKAAYEFMAAKVLADHPGGDGIGVLITHNGEACDMDTIWHYRRRHKLELPACMK